MLELKHGALEVPLHAHGRLDEKLFGAYFAVKPTLLDVAKESGAYLKALIERNTDQLRDQSSQSDKVLEDADEPDNPEATSPAPEVDWTQIHFELYKHIRELLPGDDYRGLQLAAEFGRIFGGYDETAFKAGKGVPAFKRTSRDTVKRAELERLFKGFQGRIDQYLSALGRFVCAEERHLLNQKADVSGRVQAFHALCRGSLLHSKEYLNRLLASQKRRMHKQSSAMFSINEYQDLLISSTIQSNTVYTPLKDVLHASNVFGLSCDYLDFRLNARNPLQFLQSLTKLVPKTISKALISLPPNNFSVYSLKDSQRVLLNRLIERVGADLTHIERYLRGQTDSRPRVALADLLHNRLPEDWQSFLNPSGVLEAFGGPRRRLGSLKEFLLHLLKYHNYLHMSQKQTNHKVLNMRLSPDQFSLVTSLRHKFNKYHSRFVFPLEYSVTCFLPDRVRTYTKNAQNLDEIGLLGFSVTECGFVRTEQKLVRHWNAFGLAWLALLFPQGAFEGGPCKNKNTGDLGAVTHQMNVLRVKMTQNIYSSSVLSKFIKENPVKEVFFDRSREPSEEFCVPIVARLTKGVVFRLGYAFIEKGDKPLDYWLTLNPTIRCG